MSDTFYIKQGDTSPSIQRTLGLAPGQTLVGAVGRFKMRNPHTGLVLVDQPCTLDTAENTATFHWRVGDTEVSGHLQAEWEITFAGGQIETFPNFGFDKITISPEIRPAV